MSIRSLFVASACGALLGACGGGGSGSGSPAPSSPPSLPIPATINASRVQLLQLPASGTAQSCQDTRFFIDAGGEISAFWCESPPGTSSRLMAGSIAPGASSVTVKGPVESDFVVATPAAGNFSVTPLGGRRFAVIHQLQPAAAGSVPGTRARVVDLGAASAPAVGAQTLLPANVRSTTPVLRDLSGVPYAITDQQPTPFPSISLGGADNLIVAARTQQPFVQVERDVLVEYQSVAPRALWTVVGRQAATDQRNLYIAEVSLTDGAVLPPIKVSPQPYLWANGTVTCSPSPMVQSTGVGRWAVAWGQLTTTGAGCQLMVNGLRVDSNQASVGRYAVGGVNEDLVVVWEENCGGRAIRFCRLLWSRLNPAAQTWSAPLPVYPPFDLPDLGHLVQAPGASTGGGPGMVAGPGGTLAVAWQVCQDSPGTGTCPIRANLVSKYSNGAWTTQSVSGQSFEPFDFMQLAVNASGQAAVMFGYRPSSGQSLLTLSVFRF
jgi:hypothetical protein